VLGSCCTREGSIGHKMGGFVGCCTCIEATCNHDAQHPHPTRNVRAVSCKKSMSVSDASFRANDEIKTWAGFSCEISSTCNEWQHRQGAVEGVLGGLGAEMKRVGGSGEMAKSWGGQLWWRRCWRGWGRGGGRGVMWWGRFV
jgi:hypothetical protein